MLIELLKQETPELARRWVAALLLAPESEREGIVDSVEARFVELYASSEDPDDQPILSVTSDPAQRDGYTETVTRDYTAPDDQDLDHEDPPTDTRRGSA